MVEHATINQVVDMMRQNRVYPLDYVERNGKFEMDSDASESEGRVNLLHFNISGTKFTVSRKLLSKYPESRLASPEKLKESWLPEVQAYYYDRDPSLFNSILNIYRHDVVSYPSRFDEFMFLKELEYWNISCNYLHEAIGNSGSSECLEKDFIWMESRILPPDASSSKWTKFRFKVWCFLTDPIGPYTYYRKLSLAYAMFTILTIILFMIVYGLSTKQDYRVLLPGHEVNASRTCEIKIDCYVQTMPLPWITDIMCVCFGFFLLQTFLRLVFCPNYPTYFKSILNCIDILTTVAAIVGVPFHLDYFSPTEPNHAYAIAGITMEALQVFRIFKILEYATLLDGLMVMVLTLKASINELIVLISYLIMAMFLFSTMITFVELSANLEHGIPDSLIGYWWAVVTMTTVGYGDYYPETTAGYVVGTLCALCGLIMTALPVAVIGSNFNIYWTHNKKRKNFSARQAKLLKNGQKLHG